MPLVVAAPFRGLAGKSDKRLVELAQRGDTHAIEVLYGRYATAILRYCRSLLRSTQEAEDVQQEVFVTALSALRNGAGPDTFRPWLYRVAHNACISHMRAKRPTLAAVDGELVASATTEPASEEREELRQLLDDLTALPAIQRGALLLREMDGFSYEQVGEVLGLPVTTVRSTIFRARSTLQGLAEARDAKCEEIQAELSELADRRGRRSRRITSHLHVCSDCRDFRTGLRNRPTVLRGYVPALPLGVLATLKATAIGAKGTAGGATAGAAAGGASGGMGLLSGAGASKLVAAAASACALIGGAGTQVGVLGGAGDAIDKPASIAAAAGQAARAADGAAASRSGASAARHLSSATTTQSSLAPASAGTGTAYDAPGTVVWRPAGEHRDGSGTILAGDVHGRGVADGSATTTARTGYAAVSMAHWGHARPGALGAYEEPDDNSDDSPFAPTPAPAPAPATGGSRGGDDDRTSDRGDRRGSTTASVTGSDTSNYDTSRDGGSPDEDGSRTGSGDGQTPAPEEPARDPAPAGEQTTSTTGQTPAGDPPPESSSPAPADTTQGGSDATTTTPPAPEGTQGGTTTTTTTPTEPAPSGTSTTTTTSTTATDPAPSQPPASTTP